ncbi:MAG: hypothetical protein IKD59_02900 [Lachnospiraceae bacterium]|nr:hypothetical protein [Lachnospiraceae bacterium]
MRNFEKIQRLLLDSQKARVSDMTIFNAWAKGDMSTAKCLKLFRQHNRQNDRIDISLEDFEAWMMSLGYRRQ